METITFYNYDGHPNTVNKVLNEPHEYNGNLRQTFDVTRPQLSISALHRPTYNYCYIPSLGRYYFVTEIQYAGNRKYDISLQVDVLKTYESEIMDATATVQESDTPQPYVSTRQSVYDRRPNFEQIEFPTKGLFNDKGSIIMVTIKGKDNG